MFHRTLYRNIMIEQPKPNYDKVSSFCFTSGTRPVMIKIWLKDMNKKTTRFDYVTQNISVNVVM